MIDLHKLADYEIQKLKIMGPAEIFRFFCIKLLEADYVMGKKISLKPIALEAFASRYFA